MSIEPTRVRRAGVLELVGIVLGVLCAALTAYQICLRDQEHHLALMAQVVSQRATETSTQMVLAFQSLAEFAGDPCSPASLARMRDIDLGSSLIQGVGHLTGNRIDCSSFMGVEHADAGPVDLVTANNYSVRVRRYLSFAPSVPLYMHTAPNGMTAFLHPSLVFTDSTLGDGALSGVVNRSNGVELLSNGAPWIDWKRLAPTLGQKSGVVAVADYLVAYDKLSSYDTLAYSAAPLQVVTGKFLGMLAPAIALGAVLGYLVALLAGRALRSRSSLPTLLRAGLRSNQIFVVYQPIVDMRTGEWLGAEALARWRRPNGELVSPDVFVPLAEIHGMIQELTEVVTRAVVKDLAIFTVSRPDFFVSVNVSSQDLATAGFADSLVSFAVREGVGLSNLHLEITEREGVDQDAQLRSIRELRRRGVAVGVDDFGIGYSNLAYLDVLSIDYIKIDRSFVTAAFQGSDRTAILDHLIAMAASRGLKVIAEGIERPDQKEGLLVRGVVMAQGWLFARPMSADELAAGPVPTHVEAPALELDAVA